MSGAGRWGQAVIGLWFCLAGARFAAAGQASNIILMIGDGQGFNVVRATEYYADAPPAQESFPVKLAVSTYDVYGSYDPERAWASFDYVRSGETDSSAAATAMATGVKTYQGGIGVNAAGAPLPNIVQFAALAGRSTGVVTSARWSDATPGGMVAHNTDRYDYAGLANEMIYGSRVDVIMGAGHPWYDANGAPKTTPGDFKYVGGQATWDDLVAGTPGLANPWTLIQTREEFQALATGATPARVIGAAQAYKTLQQGRSGGNVQVPFSSPPTATVPTLAEMARAALNVLDNNPRGFFLMIEGGAIDSACHSNQKGRMIEEEIGFNDAVAAVVDWVNAPGDAFDWTNTLLIVTADHETGHLWGPNSGDGTGGTIPFQPLVDNAPGNVPGMKFNSIGHTNSLVPLYAVGAGADLLSEYATRIDPRRGNYLDNTEIFRAARSLLPDPAPGDADMDGQVGFADYQLLESHFGTTTGGTWLTGDFTGDGAVDFADYQTLEQRFGMSAPEPGSAILLMLGAAVPFRRRATTRACQ